MKLSIAMLFILCTSSSSFVKSGMRLRMMSQDVNPKKIVFLGTPNVASTVLEILHANTAKYNYEVSAVVSQPPARSGRKKQLTKSPVHELAEKLSLNLYYPEKANDATFLENLEKLQPDLCITAAYGNYLPKRFLAIPKYGTINIHPSLLPKYRGAAPVQRCLENGDEKTGVTILETVTKMDAGPILYQHVKPLNGNEKSTEILQEMFEKGAKEMIELFPKLFKNEIIKTIQNEEDVSFAPKLNVTEARVDFSIDTATKIHHKVRGFADWPGVYSAFQIYDSSNNSIIEDNIRIKLITTIILQDATTTTTTITPTTISDDSNTITNTTATTMTSIDDRTIQLIKHPQYGFLLSIKCSDGSILGVLELQPAGKKVMKSRDYMNGLRQNKLLWTIPPIEKEEVNGNIHASG